MEWFAIFGFPHTDMKLLREIMLGLNTGMDQNQQIIKANYSPEKRPEVTCPKNKLSCHNFGERVLGFYSSIIENFLVCLK